MSHLSELKNSNEVKHLNKTILAIGERDPIFFAKYFLGLNINPFQERALLSLIKYKQVILVCANQVGKTVSLAIAHLWFNFYKKGFSGDPAMIDKARYETLNLSPISRQSKEAFRYIDEILHSNFSWEEDGIRRINKCRIGWFFDGRNENVGRIDFANNSSLHCLSTAEDMGSGMAGKQFAFIPYDECVQSHHLEEELGARIFSRTAKYSGPVVLTSTPDDLGKSQQYWYHLYTTAKREQADGIEGNWHLVEGVYDENIFIPLEKRDEFKERLKKLDPIKYRQVILGEFLSSADRMFTAEMIEGMWGIKTKPTLAIIDHEYVIITDWGVADAGDETVMLVVDITDIENIEVVNSYSKQGGDPVELMAMLTYLRLEYYDATLVMDVADMGGTIFKKMLSKFKPISFGQGNKPDALFFFQLRLRNNLRPQKRGDLTNSDNNAISKLKTYYLPKLERQLAAYKIDDKRIKQDWVMVMAMLCWYIEKYKVQNKLKVFPLKAFYNK